VLRSRRVHVFMASRFIKVHVAVFFEVFTVCRKCAPDHSTSIKGACLSAIKVTSCKLQDLAPLPTLTPESAGLCALGSLGNLIPVTAHQ
jgi:hypothetical protein